MQIKLLYPNLQFAAIEKADLGKHAVASFMVRNEACIISTLKPEILADIKFSVFSEWGQFR